MPLVLIPITLSVAFILVGLIVSNTGTSERTVVYKLEIVYQNGDKITLYHHDKKGASVELNTEGCLMVNDEAVACGVRSYEEIKDYKKE